MPSTEPQNEQIEQTERTDKAPRLVYAPPRLTALGDLRQLTLGGSLGRGDSGNARVQMRR